MGVGETDVIVIGGGVAGISAALEAARSSRVLIVTKGPLEESNTRYAQGGIAAVLGEDDSVDAHVDDTMRAGAGLCHADVVRQVVEEGPQAIRRFIEMGGSFDKGASGIALSLEGGHSQGRVVHSRGDATGLEVQTVLAGQARSNPSVRVMEETFVVDLVTAEGVIVGIIVLGNHGRPELIRCRGVVLATGGAGCIYRETSNPSVATGDGLAVAYRAGAPLRGLEFVQFHPTTLYVAGAPRLLISETVRGEGGVLVDRDGRRFMTGVHPQAELAPRDIVSRGIARQIAESGDSCVYLDVRHIHAEHFRKRFPGISRVLDQYGVDFTREPIPVHPAAHFMMGGVVADIEGRTSMQGLFAAGEVASTGLHGANRLGSNSLLEGLVCGVRAGRNAAASPDVRAQRFDDGDRPDDAEQWTLDRFDLWNSVRSTMWRRVGIERNGTELRHAAEKLDRWSRPLFRTRFKDAGGIALMNAMTLARLVTHAATARLESRGAHFRTDHPERDDKNWRCDLVMARGNNSAT